MATAWLREAQDASRGRHLVANTLNPPGTTSLTQAAVAYILYDDQKLLRCHWSLHLVRSPLRCGACKHARYASRDNQRTAWTSGHKQECAALTACYPKVPPPTIRLVARLFWRLRRASTHSSSNGADADVAAVLKLQHHWEDLPDRKKETFAQMAALTREYMQGGLTTEAGLPAIRDIALMIARCACNNHTICDDELRPIGVGLYPRGALINHSGTPNAMQTFEGQQICFRALQPIQEGSEVTISYIELAATRAERRQQLLQQYYFDIDAHAGAKQEPEALLHCRAGAVTAELYAEAPCSTEPADAQLTAVTTTPVQSADAFVSASLQQQQHSNSMQSSFPHSLSAMMGDGEPMVSNGEETRLMPAMAGGGASASSGEGSASRLQPAAVPDGSLTAPEGAAMDSTEEQSVHVQCWGAGLSGLTGDSLRALSQTMAQIVRQHKQCEWLMTSGQPVKAQALACSALHLADSLPRPLRALGPNHIWRMRLNEVLLRACVACGINWRMALQTAQKLQPVYENVYPKVWPNKGLHYAMMSKLAALLEQDDVAASTAELALQQLQYTHADSPILESVRQTLFESSRES